MGHNLLTSHARTRPSTNPHSRIVFLSSSYISFHLCLFLFLLFTQAIEHSGAHPCPFIFPFAFSAFLFFSYGPLIFVFRLREVPYAKSPVFSLIDNPLRCEVGTNIDPGAPTSYCFGFLCVLYRRTKHTNRASVEFEGSRT